MEGMKRIEYEQQLNAGDIVEAGLFERWRLVVVRSYMTLMGEYVEALTTDGELVEIRVDRLAGERGVVIGNVPLADIVSGVLKAAGIEDEEVDG